MLKKFFQSSESACSKKKEAKNPTCEELYLATNQPSPTQAALTYYRLAEPESISVSFNTLDKKEMAYRLWTCHQLLHQSVFFPENLFASSVLLDGKGHIMVADSLSHCVFLATYDEFGYAIGVTRLNPGSALKKEKTRLGTSIHCHRLKGIASFLNDKGKIQLIYCKARLIERKNQCQQERYLLKTIRMLDPLGIRDLQVLEEKLVQEVIGDMMIGNSQSDGTESRIFFAIQRVETVRVAALLGFYQYQGMDSSSSRLAVETLSRFKEQVSLTPKAYACQAWGVQNNQTKYYRDNTFQIFHELIIFFKQYQSTLDNRTLIDAIKGWVKILEEDSFDYPTRAKNLYAVLTDSNPLLENKSVIEYIQQVDKSESAAFFLKHFATIVQTQLAGILPALLVSSLLLLMTHELAEREDRQSMDPADKPRELGLG